ncbi:MAG: hypothetical protein IKW49_00530 [Opitutales bacterium]|nr:hypothetical protein [Opitutales bacterium]
MIGFFQNTMAKHHRLMFGLLLVVIVVSFVFYTGSGSAMDLLGFRKSPEVCGVKLNDREAEIYRTAVLLTSGRDISESQFRTALVQRVVLEHLADTYQVPNPSQEAFDAFTKQFFGLKDGEVLDPKRFGLNIDPETLKTILVQTCRIAELQNIFAGSPAALDADIVLRWQELNTQWELESAKLSLAALKVEPKASEADLEKYFAANAENYRIAPMVKLAYAVVQPSAEMRAKIGEPTDAELKLFIRMQDRKLSDDKAVTDALAKERAAWVKRWKDDRLSLQVASSTSDMLADKLPQELISPDMPEFAENVKAAGLELKTLPAFPQDAVPAKAPIPEAVLREVATSLNSTLWRTDAIPHGENALVVVFLGSDPSRIPALSEIREQVTADWLEAEKDSLRFDRARELGAQLRKDVAAGKPFADAAKALGMTATKPAAAVTMQNVPADLQVVSYALFESLKSTPLNTVSDILYAGDVAYFVRPSQKTIPELDKNSKEFAQLVDFVNMQIAGTTLNVQLSQRIGEELFKVTPPQENAEQE